MPGRTYNPQRRGYQQVLLKNKLAPTFIAGRRQCLALSNDFSTRDFVCLRYKEQDHVLCQTKIQAITKALDWLKATISLRKIKKKILYEGERSRNNNMSTKRQKRKTKQVRISIRWHKRLKIDAAENDTTISKFLDAIFKNNYQKQDK